MQKLENFVDKSLGLENGASGQVNVLPTVSSSAAKQTQSVIGITHRSLAVKILRRLINEANFLAVANSIFWGRNSLSNLSSVREGILAKTFTKKKHFQLFLGNKSEYRC